MTKGIHAVACTAALLAGLAAGTAGATELIALTDQGELVRFADNRLAAAAPVRVTGLSGALVGIDFRPADKKLYGLTADSGLYEIDSRTGAAKQVSKLSVPVATGGPVVVDFNPVADRLRVIGPGGQSLRIVVESGATTEDKKLNYASDDRAAGRNPGVLAGAYTNSVAGTKSTQLMDIDGATLLLQNPPNDGVLKSVAAIEGLPGPIQGFDIASPGEGTNTAFILAGGSLFNLDLASGKLTAVGKVNSRAAGFIDLAAVPAN